MVGSRETIVHRRRPRAGRVAALRVDEIVIHRIRAMQQMCGLVSTRYPQVVTGFFTT
jgi:hypothetical protein